MVTDVGVWNNDIFASWVPCCLWRCAIPPSWSEDARAETEDRGIVGDEAADVIDYII